MPPPSTPSTPPTIEESLAKLGDSIDKLELVTKRLVAKRLAACVAIIHSNFNGEDGRLPETMVVFRSVDHMGGMVSFCTARRQATSSSTSFNEEMTSSSSSSLVAQAIKASAVHRDSSVSSAYVASPASKTSSFNDHRSSSKV
ncbi:hypothetical protein Tco_0526288 [Tanacetum coccineum]